MNQFSNRVLKINSLLKKELGKIIFREVDFPEGALVTLTRAETLANLSESKIYVSVVPEEKKEKVFEILNKEIFGIQQKLNKILKMRPVPKIIFKKETKTKKAAEIEQIIEKIKKR